ncbi:TPA: hypothetical protein NGR36_000226 [Vibrio parahaemolyticus]|uniref:Uncharacterized protein n=1 Tax=Vibrio parahaemolyticus TaxID=670 RepID=A0A7M1VV39_VIBPH|nr:hypothetical protein VP46_00046 [Vibrio parahaemolyticus]QOS24424.1 hypothetical protein VP47_00046 [Vibrio parahaemolyticus]HCE1501080.1 hypothetical protein [Vibrio parahaemolyticus]HCH5612347.1 hypothetical protein [Vibrio parahaemolyticus]HCM0779355.1 hypothetical protein [Vibrio parahaemolyticus]
MAEKTSVVVVDWRNYGDFSAVGQLTKKIFSQIEQLEITTVQVIDGIKCNLHKVNNSNEIKRVVDWSLYHDAVIHWVKKNKIENIYIRLSPHLATLEFACKLILACENLRVITHFMDTPHLKEMPKSKVKYIESLYKFLIGRSENVMTIHDSSVRWIEDKYSVNPQVLGNFINGDLFTRHKVGNSSGKIRVSYFGSVDKKMNALSLYQFSKSIENIEWLEFNIWSNSGMWGDLKEVVDRSNNIKYMASSLSEEEYSNEICKSDYLLLPYNSDEESIEFLKYSYSNKFIDYLENGGRVIAFGSEDIPTIHECKANRLGVVVSSVDELERLVLSKKTFMAAISHIYDGDYISRIEKLSFDKKNNLDKFKKLILAPGVEINKKTTSSYAGLCLESELGFFIKRKFWDKEHNKQSLSASISSYRLKKYNYNGYNYEV